MVHLESGANAMRFSGTCSIDSCGNCESKCYGNNERQEKKTWHFVVLKQTHICAKETKNEQRGLTAIDEAMECKPEIITLLQRQNHHHFFPRVLFP